jgi:hypothetical protein
MSASMIMDRECLRLLSDIAWLATSDDENVDEETPVNAADLGHDPAWFSALASLLVSWGYLETLRGGYVPTAKGWFAAADFIDPTVARQVEVVHGGPKGAGEG